jgi:hypothetical protein
MNDDPPEPASIAGPKLPSNLPPFNWKQFIGILVIAFVILFAVIGFHLFNTWRKIPESYAAWTAGNLIVDYLNTHSNQWPRSWEDLDQATNCLRYVPVPQLREKIKVDWQVNFMLLMREVETNSRTPVRLVTRLDGSPLYAVWGRDTDPNTKILGYLKWLLIQTNMVSGAKTN